MNEQTLPGMPEPPEPPVARVTPAKATAVRITKRTLCNQCCVLIHHLGVQAAPYPRTARWRVTISGLSTPLCEAHKNEVM